jgi:zinc transport system substrate-binding protein
MQNKRILLAVVAVLLIGLGANYLMNSREGAPAATKGSSQVKVAATIFPVYDIARQVAGDRAEVVGILPPGTSPHTFNPKPSDLAKLEGSKLVFAIGHGLDNWTESLLENLDGATVVTVDQGISLREFGEMHEHEHEGEEHGHEHDEDEHVGEKHEGEEHEGDEHGDEHGHDHEGVDPHYWLDAENASLIAATIAKSLGAVDPENADYYQANLTSLQAEMVELDAELASTLAPAADKGLIMFHDSWNYLAAAYDLEVAGVFQISPGKEPTPQYLKELYETAEKHGVSTVFTEPQLGSTAIQPLIEDLGLNVDTLDPLGGVEGRDSYAALMRYNASTIVSSVQDR